MSSATVIIPTLNEAENIDVLLQEILVVKKACGIDFKVLFVDSASTDSTCDEVEKWDQGDITLLQRSCNCGLAAAVIAGAHQATSKYIAVMDADLSHPPEIIPQLFEPLINGSHDLVIGSRYVEGGATPDWPMSRIISSKIATFPASFFCTVHDPLAGFFSIRRDLITSFPHKVPGFKICLALLAHYNKKIRVKEVPIIFRDRDLGESKMTKTIVLLYLRQLLFLVLQRLRH